MKKQGILNADASVIDNVFAISDKIEELADDDCSGTGYGPGGRDISIVGDSVDDVMDTYALIGRFLGRSYGLPTCCGEVYYSVVFYLPSPPSEEGDPWHGTITIVADNAPYT